MEKVEKYFNKLNKQFLRKHNYFIKLVNDSDYSGREKIEILKAYHCAADLHNNQKRKSGEAYINHPLNIACNLITYGFDYETICAALLHDTIEDTPYSLDELRRDFGDNVAMLVDGVTKMKGAKFANKEEAKQATHEKIVQSITKDARIIAIKLVDRLHNMLTLNALKEPRKMREIALETLEFYVPLARFLGIYKLKDELQDLSLFYLNPEMFLECYEKRREIKKENVEASQYVAKQTKEALSDLGIKMAYDYKVKNAGGIFAEIESGKAINDIVDLVAIKMLVDNPENCYLTLGVVHSEVKDCYHVLGTFEDYISTPKPNGYQSLNTAVRYKDSQLQIRIRTHEMNRVNSLGVVGNWNPDSQKVIAENCLRLVREGYQKSSPEFDRALKPLTKQKGC